jgi:hypothetical protein
MVDPTVLFLMLGIHKFYAYLDTMHHGLGRLVFRLIGFYIFMNSVFYYAKLLACNLTHLHARKPELDLRLNMPIFLFTMELLRLCAHIFNCGYLSQPVVGVCMVYMFLVHRVLKNARGRCIFFGIMVAVLSVHYTVNTALLRLNAAYMGVRLWGEQRVACRSVDHLCLI